MKIAIYNCTIIASAVLFSCNNVGIQSQDQHGHLAAGQQWPFF